MRVDGSNTVLTKFPSPFDAPGKQQNALQTSWANGKVYHI